VIFDDIILNKKESIERCIKQIRKYYALPSDKPFEEDFMRQDAIALNLQQACEQSIDLANHLIKVNKFGLPKESRECFSILAERGVIESWLARNLQGMVGFRNTLVHQYQVVDPAIMVSVIERHLDDLIVFTNAVMNFQHSEG